MSVIGADDLRVTHPSASGIATPRLACVRHAANVRPEPGSNSPLLFIFEFYFNVIGRIKIRHSLINWLIELLLGIFI